VRVLRVFALKRESLAGYENSGLVRSYQPKIVPGLLQTAA